MTTYLREAGKECVGSELTVIKINYTPAAAGLNFDKSVFLSDERHWFIYIFDALFHFVYVYVFVCYVMDYKEALGTDK